MLSICVATDAAGCNFAHIVSVLLNEGRLPALSTSVEA
jgi:hypothetical protein